MNQRDKNRNQYEEKEETIINLQSKLKEQDKKILE